MEQKSFAQWVLQPYIDLTATCSVPLHAEGVALQASGTMDLAYEAITLLGMWLPAGYRRRLRERGVVPVEADLTGTVPISPPLDQLRSRVREQTNLEQNHYLLLAWFSEYELLVSLPPREDVCCRYLRERATALLQESIGQTYTLEALRTLVSDRHARSLETFIANTTLIAELAARDELDYARLLFKSEYEALEVSMARVPSWLADICEVKLRVLNGAILKVQGDIALAVEIWMGLLDSFRHYPPDNVAASWLCRESERRLLERCVHAMLGEGWLEDCVDLARRAVQLDPHDGRAHLLLGDALLITEPSSAVEAYCNASHLDPTLESLAAFSAGRALERSGQLSEALHEFKRSLDRDPKNETASRWIQKIEPDPDSPILPWCRTAVGERHNWVFTTYRPFFDLSPVEAAPLFAQAPRLAFDHWWLRSPRPNVIQRVMAPGFRVAICRQAYRPEYDVWEPRLLPRHLWTERWSMLVEALADIDRVDLDECSRLCQILNALAMYEPILLYLNSFKECPEDCSAEEADLAYRYAFAESMLFIGAQGRLHSPARFELVAERAPRGCRAAFAASLYLIVYTARFERDWQSAHKWYLVARETLSSLNYPADGFRYLMGESRFHRAAAYLPFLKGDFDQAIKELERGLEFANRMRPCDEDELILRDENLYPLLQSTAKAYMAAGELDRALEYLRKVVALDPWDSIARLELGNALFQLDRFEEAAASYEWAISLAPPGMAHAAYLAAEAYRQLGRDARATHMYLRSLTADPDGISPKQKLAEISSLPAARDYATILS